MNWDLNLIKVFLESDKKRKETAFMMYYFLMNDVENIRTYLENYGKAGGMFSDNTMKMLPKTHRDLTNKVLNNTCLAYNYGVDRYLVGKDDKIDEPATELLNELYDKAGIDDTQDEWYRAGVLFNTVEVKTVWRKSTNQAEFDVWTPNFFTVWENPETKYLKDAIIFDVKHIDKNGNDIEAQEFWSKDQHFYFLQEGTFNDGGVGKPKMVRSDLDGDNPEGKNPYGIIPSTVLRFKRGEDYYGIGKLDLVEENIWADLRRSNFVYVEIFQGNGIIYAVNFGESDKMPLTPNKILTVNNVKGDDKEPFIDSIATNALLSDIRENLKDNETDLLVNQGLSGQTGSADNNNAPALSKALDLEELELMRKKHKGILENFELRNYEVFRTVHNKNSSRQLNPELKFICNIYDPKPSWGISDLIAKRTFELEQGMTNPINLMIEDDPDLTLKEAEIEYEKNIKFRTEKTNNPETTDNTDTIDDPVE